jgi:hypothetical protein
VLARHIGQLTLTPKKTETGPVHEVEGGLDLLPDSGGGCVMSLVARDGNEGTASGCLFRSMASISIRKWVGLSDMA